MKKFKFHLETILKLRTLTLDEKIRALSEIVSLVNSYKTRILENEGEIEISRKKLTETIQAGVDLSGFRAYDAYIKRLYAEIDNFILAVENQNSALNKAREEVFEARKKVRIIEILKENQYEEYKKRLSKAERNETEEFNIISASRRKRIGDFKTEFKRPVEFDEEEYDEGERERPKKEFDQLRELYDKFK